MKTSEKDRSIVAYELLRKTLNALTQKMSSFKASFHHQNSVKQLNEPQWLKTSLDTNVKLAGDEAKDRLYEPKHKKKLVRVLTVVAYIFFVSLAAIMLSLYYVFLWNGNQKENARNVAAQRLFTTPRTKCIIVGRY